MEQQTAQEVLGNAQAVSVLTSLLVVIGRAEKYRQDLGQPVLCRVVLADPQQTTTAISADLLTPILRVRAEELMQELQDKGISTAEMIEEIEKQLEGKSADKK